jgi:hypothetical protein
MKMWNCWAGLEHQGPFVQMGLFLCPVLTSEQSFLVLLPWVTAAPAATPNHRAMVGIVLWATQVQY